MTKFTYKFKKAMITGALIEEALDFYKNDTNGKFYSETYDEIIALFSTLSVPIRVLLTCSWMHGNYKPKPKYFHHLNLSRKFRKFINTEQQNVRSVADAYETAENALRSIAASKYLHFLFPDTFPMWDYKIQRFVFGNKLSPTGNREEYRRFFLELGKKYSASGLDARKLKGYTVPRLLDIWLWKQSR